MNVVSKERTLKRNWKTADAPKVPIQMKLGNAMKEMHASILKARNDLEHHSIEGLIGGARRF